MFCPNCKAEYREGFTHCSDCDVDLVPSLSESGKKEGGNDDVTFIPILSTFNLGDIAILKSILNDQGIEYFLQGENTAHIRGYMDPTILMVRNDQAESIKELLKNFDLKFTMFSTKQY